MRDTLESPFQQRFPESDVQLVELEIRSFVSIVQVLRGMVKVRAHRIILIQHVTKSGMKSGIQQLFTQLLRPRLRQFMSDVYKDITYVLLEESYSTVEYENPVPKRFIKSWSAMFDVFKVNSNYSAVIRLNMRSIRTHSQSSIT
jgi:hypothetical protein